MSDPSRCQMEFKVDGSLSIKADCNTVEASYQVGEGNTMTITPGASTRMACPPDSQADAFMQQLGATASYEFSQGALLLHQADTTQVMVFQMLPVAILPTPEANGPSATSNTYVNLRSGPSENYNIYGVMEYGQTAEVVGKSEDGKWWALNMPVSPTGTGWSSADYVTVSNAGSVPVLLAPPVPPSVEPVAPGPNDPQVTAIEPVYVREGPGETFPAYGVAQPGQTALVIGRSQDSAYRVVRVNPASISTYGKIPAGVPLQVTGQVDVWLSVVMPALPGGIGWISGNYVLPYTEAVATPY